MELFFNNKQRWNEDQCRFECKECIDKGVCNKGFTWNPSNCECEGDKGCDINECIDYESCKCRKKLVDQRVKKCTENISETNFFKKTFDKNENKDKCNSYVVYKVLLWTFFIFFIISLGISIWIMVNRNYPIK